jgi:hypothetical protein
LVERKLIVVTQVKALLLLQLKVQVGNDGKQKIQQLLLNGYEIIIKKI